MRKFEVKSGTISTRFEDVVGNDDLVDELKNIVKFMKTPEQFSKVGATLPNGCLLMGPHGSGKTLIARAVAGLFAKSLILT